MYRDDQVDNMKCTIQGQEGTGVQCLSQYQIGKNCTKDGIKSKLCNLSSESSNNRSTSACPYNFARLTCKKGMRAGNNMSQNGLYWGTNCEDRHWDNIDIKEYSVVKRFAVSRWFPCDPFDLRGGRGGGTYTDSRNRPEAEKRKDTSCYQEENYGETINQTCRRIYGNDFVGIGNKDHDQCVEQELLVKEILFQ